MRGGALGLASSPPLTAHQQHAPPVDLSSPFPPSPLHDRAFEKLADLKNGMMGIQWRRVPCSYRPSDPAPDGPTGMPGSEQPKALGYPGDAYSPGTDLTGEQLVVRFDDAGAKQGAGRGLGLQVGGLAMEGFGSRAWWRAQSSNCQVWNGSMLLFWRAFEPTMPHRASDVPLPSLSLSVLQARCAPCRAPTRVQASRW